MAINWSDIRKNSQVFANNWKDAKSERAESQTFWNEFFEVFGITRRRLATFEAPVKKLSGTYGFIDLFWKGVLLVEHKSKGEDLDKAYTQALGYFANLKEFELPKYILVSDFERFRLHDLEDSLEHEFSLSELPDYINLLGFVAGFDKKRVIDDIPVNIEAANKMAKLHDLLTDVGFSGHELDVFLMRLLYCLFADDTGLFQKKLFAEFLRDNTKENGSDLGEKLSTLFQTLDKSVDNRQRNIDPWLNEFPYVNGSLFTEKLDTVYFDENMREILLECTHFNWSGISPAIFGSMFQSAMDKEKRRELGAHYTSEKNILKLIKPLFLDSLRSEFDKIKVEKVSKETKLKQFLEKISKLQFLDPACGCGNFLIVAYRELRLLEIEILLESLKLKNLEKPFSPSVDINQFYGIELEEFPAKIAETALWLTEHQLNIELSNRTEIFQSSLPLFNSNSIINKNALTFDWNKVLDNRHASYIIGNPPFKGVDQQTLIERAELKKLFQNKTGSGKLNYVAGWFVKAAQYIENTDIEVAFVATNAITKGSQVDTLWSKLLFQHQSKINFAHRTFKWSSEAKQNAAIHVVIIGFAFNSKREKHLFYYEDPSGEPELRKVSKINPYLLESDNILVKDRSTPICNVPEIRKGNQPTDKGYLLLTDSEKDELLKESPNLKRYIKRVMGTNEMLHDKNRWCLWLVNATSKEIKSFKAIHQRLASVKKFRLNSPDSAAVKLASTPYLFREQNNPSKYLAIPTTTSENRQYLTAKFLDSSVIPTNNLFICPEADLWHFGIISSYMSRVWTENICGRTDNRNRYSKKIGYNAFPWPENPSSKDVGDVIKAAKAVLKARELEPNQPLADMYDPFCMPKALVSAHVKLDRAVENCYQIKGFNNDLERIEFLFELYRQYSEK
jgi:type I restriction-modification system DNA methylase subunit